MGGFAESATWTVMLNVPAAVAVPLIVPSPLSVRPAGRLPPASDHVYGCVPPVAANENEYAAENGAGGLPDAGRAYLIKY